MKTEIKDPRDLSLHWTRKLLPMPSQEVVNAISDSIKRGDHLPPAYIVAPDLLVAGEARRLAYCAQQKDMEVIVVSEEEALRIIFAENTNRRQYPFKYQIAWDYCALALKVAEAALRRKTANLKIGQKPNDSPRVQSLDSRRGSPANIEEIADALIVSRALFFDVLAFYRKAQDWDLENEPQCIGDSEKPMTAMQFISWRIHDVDKPCTPGEAWRGIMGSVATKDGQRIPPRQFLLFTQAVDKLVSRFEYWQAFDPAEKRQAMQQIKSATIDHFDPENCGELADLLLALAKAARERAKQPVAEEA